MPPDGSRICNPLPGSGEFSAKQLTLRELRESNHDTENAGADFLLSLEQWLLSCPRQLTMKERQAILGVIEKNRSR